MEGDMKRDANESLAKEENTWAKCREITQKDSDREKHQNDSKMKEKIRL